MVIVVSMAVGGLHIGFLLYPTKSFPPPSAVVQSGQLHTDMSLVFQESGVRRQRSQAAFTLTSWARGEFVLFGFKSWEISHKTGLALVVHTFNPSTPEVEAGRSV